MKSGIPYFPLDVKMDTSVELLEAEFGLKGFAVVVKLYQLIYGEHGYFGEWNDEVRLLFSRKNGVGGDLVSNIIKVAIKRGIFSGEKFEKYGILTSRGIQERYLKAVARRQEIKLESKYLLIPYDLLPKNVTISSGNADNFSENVDIFKQSKVKKSKVKKSKLLQQHSGGCQPFYLPAIHKLEEIKGAPLNGHEMRRITELVEDYGIQWVLDALEVMGDSGKCKINFLNGILQNWKADGKQAKRQKSPFSEEAERWFLETEKETTQTEEGGKNE